MNIFHAANIKHRIVSIVIGSLLITGCVSALVSTVTNDLAANLTTAVLNQNDPDTVRDGAPAYLLLLDSLVEENPEDPLILSSAATLYATYGTVFATDVKRASRLTERARKYSSRAMCNAYMPACEWSGMLFADYQKTLGGLKPKDAQVVYSYGLSSLAWIRVHSADYKAIAYLPYVEALFDRYLEINDGLDDATIHTYLGILKSLIPAAVGGDPEEGRAHFEHAIHLSNGKDLSAKVEFANSYARLLYQRDLHDRLLNEVLAANPESPLLTLTNILAQQQAKELLETADNYF